MEMACVDCAARACVQNYVLRCLAVAALSLGAAGIVFVPKFVQLCFGNDNDGDGDAEPATGATRTATRLVQFSTRMNTYARGARAPSQSLQRVVCAAQRAR